MESELKPILNDQFFFGVVTSSDAATYAVQIAPTGQHNFGLIQGIPLASTFAHLLGIKECLVPQPGSRVFCCKSDVGQCVILGTVPPVDYVSEGGMYPARSIIGSGDSTNDAVNQQGYFGAGISKLLLQNATRPTDVVSGEHVLANEFGVMLGLFQGFATLKASELAQVQTFILDDLVRIVSHNFQHYSALGEFKISHDGKLIHAEFGMTHDPNEALGTPQVEEVLNDPSIVKNAKPDKTDKDSFYSLVVDDRQIAIERLKGFIGSLGEFVNIMLVRPAEAQTRTLNGDSITIPDTGLSGVKMDLDGGIYIRSVKGVFLEKTNWIRVPHRKLSPEDPAGNDAGKDFEVPLKEKFSFDNSILVDGQPFLYFLQIRDYLAYVQDDLSYRSFKALNKDFSVNDDPSLEVQLEDINKVHPLHETKLEKRTAFIGAMPNGGIVLKDAWGSSIVMEGGNIYIQPAKDLVMQPLRHMVAKVGSHVSIASRNDIDMSSTDGGFRLKTDLAQYLYSNSSGILLHAGADFGGVILPETDAMTTIGGIVLHAPESSIVADSAYSLKRTTDRDITHGVEIFINADNDLELKSNNRLDMFSDGDLLIGTVGLLSVVGEGESIFLGKQATVIGMKDQDFGIANLGTLGEAPVQGFIDDRGIESLINYSAQIRAIVPQEFAASFSDDEDFKKLTFRFIGSSAYSLTSGVDVIPQTIAQQEANEFGTTGLTAWNERIINDTYPFPGVELKSSFVTGALDNLQKVENGEIYNKTTCNSTSTLTFGANLFTDYKTYG